MYVGPTCVYSCMNMVELNADEVTKRVTNKES